MIHTVAALDLPPVLALLPLPIARSIAAKIRRALRGSN
jgi:hypothetical protein